MKACKFGAKLWLKSDLRDEINKIVALNFLNAYGKTDQITRIFLAM